MTTRQDAYTVIDGERTYQDTQVDPSKYGLNDSATFAYYLTVLDTYLRKAQDSYTFDGVEQSLHQIRKLAAIAVHCMEDHGAPPRVLPEEVPVDIPW